jgi:hypothetical protein
MFEGRLSCRGLFHDKCRAAIDGSMNDTILERYSVECHFVALCWISKFESPHDAICYSRPTGGIRVSTVIPCPAPTMRALLFISRPCGWSARSARQMSYIQKGVYRGRPETGDTSHCHDSRKRSSDDFTHRCSIPRRRGLAPYPY